MAKKIFAIIGATGKQGGSVANAFLNDPSYQLRIITRNVNGASAEEWTAKGVEVVQADLDDVQSLKSAFAGAQVIYAMTDFWGPMGNEQNHEKATEQGISICEFCYNLEVQRGKNLAIAAESTYQSIDRYVYSSLSDARTLSKGKYTHIWHFDSKALVERFIRSAPEMKNLAPKSSFIQIGQYLDGYKSAGPLSITKDEKTGKYFQCGVGNGDRKLPLIWTTKDTGTLVKGLINSKAGQTMIGYSQRLTPREFMQIWAKTLGVELLNGGFKPLTRQEFYDVMEPAFLKEHFADALAYFDEFGYDGGDPKIITPHDVSTLIIQ